MPLPQSKQDNADNWWRRILKLRKAHKPHASRKTRSPASEENYWFPVHRHGSTCRVRAWTRAMSLSVSCRTVVDLLREALCTYTSTRADARRFSFLSSYWKENQKGVEKCPSYLRTYTCIHRYRHGTPHRGALCLTLCRLDR